MSTATDLAKAEADAADAENPDENQDENPDEPVDEPEPDPETPPQPEPAAMTEQQADRLFKRLETAAQRYLKTAMPLTEELGMPVQACPLCTFPGLAIRRQAHEVTSDVEGAVLAMIGKEVEPPYPEFAGFKRCDTCKGWGEVMTGAMIERSRHTTCPNPLCGGKGYVTVSLDPTPATPTPQFPGATLPYTPLPTGVQDAWGRPAGHPHWGLDPAMVGSPNGAQVG